MQANQNELTKAPPMPQKKSRKQSTSLISAVLLGIPLAVGVIAALRYGPWQHPLIQRYTSHPVEWVEIAIFCCALGALGGKLLGVLRQRLALCTKVLPEWEGNPLPASEATGILAHVSRLPRWVQKSWVGQRVKEVVDYVACRRSAADVDEQIRTLAENDAINLEGSYALTRFLIWSMPILGFLGTVLGIAGAIAGVSPEVLEKSIGTVTQGLATAFDTTGLALILTIATMFLTFVVERMEQSVMEQVDIYTDLHLTHRFARPAAEHGPVIDAVESSAKAVMEATGKLVEHQAELWASKLAESDKRLKQAEKNQETRLTEALERAMASSLASHQARLTELEQTMQQEAMASLQPMASLAEVLGQHQATLQPLTEATGALAQVLSQLQEQEGHLSRMQSQLQENLHAVASTGSFEQAVHSLTAAVHLLTAKASTAPRLHTEDHAA